MYVEFSAGLIWYIVHPSLNIMEDVSYYSCEYLIQYLISGDQLHISLCHQNYSATKSSADSIYLASVTRALPDMLDGSGNEAIHNNVSSR